MFYIRKKGNFQGGSNEKQICQTEIALIKLCAIDAVFHFCHVP